MGVIFIVPGADYSALNLGTATPSDALPIEAIAIAGPSEIFGQQSYQAKLFPTFTTQRGVSWSIVSGVAYASISQDGVVSPATDVVSQQVTIRCTSTADATIYGEKTIQVTDSGTIVIFDTIKFDGQSAIDTGIKADMPTDIQVTMAQMYIEDWGILNAGAGVRTAVIIGGRDGNAYNRRDIQLSATAQTNNINDVVFGVGDTSKNIKGLSLPKGNELYVSQGPTHYTVNNDVTPRTAQGTFTSNTNYVIGAQNTGGTIVYTYASHDKFKRVKIYATEGGTLLRDFVPATKNGTPGMLDNVSHIFFSNIGTGTLIVE